MKSHCTRLAPLALALALAACSGSPTRPDSSSHDLPDLHAAPAVRVAEAFMTPSMREHEVDSVAAWPTPTGETWLIATAKASNQLVVYDGDTGALLRTVGSPGDKPGQFQRPNGIAVYGDLVFVVERDNQRVQILRLPAFEPVTTFGNGELLSPYGLWLRELTPDTLELLVTDSFMADFRTELVPPLDDLDGRVKRYRIAMGGEVPRATLQGQFGDTTPAGALRMVESIAGDPAHDRLLIAEEDVRVGTTLREYRMDGSYTGRNLPPERFQAQAEGVALWACADGSGYWITADQSTERTVFHVFDRADLTFRGSFAGNTVSLTDGIWLHSVATRRFPYGVLYAAHDDQGAGAFDWRDIASALSLRRDCAAP
ncbi:phytase [Arenimonas sp. MALMAid1274]|uniref:phytase n=1 Tax=Arenimonas sp. MALMAid1274 TaxID=3411630 RepID=UPI003BA33B0C